MQVKNVNTVKTRYLAIFSSVKLSNAAKLSSVAEMVKHMQNMQVCFSSTAIWKVESDLNQHTVSTVPVLTMNVYHLNLHYLSCWLQYERLVVSRLHLKHNCSAAKHTILISAFFVYSAGCSFRHINDF